MNKSDSRGHCILVTMVACVIPALLPWAASFAGEGTLNLHKAIPFKSGITVPEAVKNECELPTKLATFTKSYSEDLYATVNLLDNPSNNAPGQTLLMEIVGVDSQPGGRFTGRKGVSIEGTLWENGKVKGSFQATRYSGGGGGPRWKGTCSILGRDVKALGKDVSVWLKAPSMKARLGEAE